MKLIILIAFLTQVFAVEHAGVVVPHVDVPKVGDPQVGVPNVQNPHVHGVPQHVQHMAEKHINHILQHVPQVQNHIKQLQQQAEVKKNIGVPHVQNPHVQGVPPHVQHMAEQHINHILQHVPQVQNHIKQLQQQTEVKKNIGVPHVQNSHVQGVPPHVQHMAEQHINHILQHAPQVQSHVNQLLHQKEVVQKNVVVPNLHVPNVPGVPQHVQQFAKQHLTHVLQHVPQVQSHIKEHQKVSQLIPDVPNSPIHVKGHHVTIPQASQVISKKVGLPVQQFPNVPQNVQQIVQQVQQHVPQVINAHINQQRAPKAVHIPPHVQSIVGQVHQHIPQVINQHLQQHQHHHNRVGDSSKCVFQCTRLDMNVCATNGKCWKQFNSLCQMSKWNCLNTERTFHQVDDAQCMDTAKPKCYPGDI